MRQLAQITPTGAVYSSADLSPVRPVRAIVVFDESSATTSSVAIERRPIGRLRRLFARRPGDDGERRAWYVGRRRARAD